MSREKKSRLARIGPKLDNLIKQTKNKNSLSSYVEAGERMADFLSDAKNKTKNKMKIIREIEF